MITEQLNEMRSKEIYNDSNTNEDDIFYQNLDGELSNYYISEKGQVYENGCDIPLPVNKDTNEISMRVNNQNLIVDLRVLNMYYNYYKEEGYMDDMKLLGTSYKDLVVNFKLLWFKNIPLLVKTDLETEGLEFSLIYNEGRLYFSQQGDRLLVGRLKDDYINVLTGEILVDYEGKYSSWFKDVID